MNEAQIQAEMVKWFNSEYPELRGLLFHIPNEVEERNNKSRMIRIGRLVTLGLVKGIPDLFLAIPRNGFSGMFIEVKQPTGTLSEAQRSIISKLQGQSYQVNVIRSLEAFKMAVVEYLLN